MRLLQSFVVVVHRHGEVALGVILPYDVLIEIVLYFLRLGHLGFPFLAFLSRPFLVIHVRLFHNAVSLRSTVLADVSVDSCDKQFHLFVRASAEATYFLCHDLSFRVYS